MAKSNPMPYGVQKNNENNNNTLRINSELQFGRYELSRWWMVLYVCLCFRDHTLIINENSRFGLNAIVIGGFA